MFPKNEEMELTGKRTFEDTTNRFPRDQLLRRHGFVLKCRPKGKEAIWMLGDTPYTESEALDYCNKELRSVQK